MSPITARGVETRDRIVAAAAAEIRENGVGATLDDIRSRSHTSKGQIFHYFPRGKDELLLAVAQLEAARVLSDQEPFLGALADADTWWRWRDAVIARYREQGVECPIATITRELGRATPGAEAVVRQLIAEWEGRLERGMSRLGLEDSTRHARTLLAAIQGGVQLMISTGRFDYLEDGLDTLLSTYVGTRIAA